MPGGPGWPPSLASLREQLETIPASPLPASHPRSVLYRFRRTVDLLSHARVSSSRLIAAMRPYPKPFRHVTIHAEDHVTIAGWLGVPSGKAGQGVAERVDLGIVIVPGMFSTKDDALHRNRALRMLREWGVSVLSIDLRAFGESTGISTAGWKEALDVHGAARFLAENAGVSRVGVLAESLGGAATLNALALDAESGTDLFSGGALCFSAFMDAKDAVEYITSEPPAGHAFHSSWAGFRTLLSIKSHGAYDRFDDFLADAARVYGLPDLEELYTLANPKWKVSLIRQPTLCVHAQNDPVVPVRHARCLERYARDYPHVQVLVTPWGEHTAFEPLDPVWFWEVARRFFNHVNGTRFPNLADPSQPEPDDPDA